MDEIVHLGGNPGNDIPYPRDLGLEMLLVQFVAWSLEGCGAIEAFVEHAAERIEVGPRVHRFALPLFGGHVLGGSCEEFQVEGLACHRLSEAGDETEVDEHETAVLAQKYVLGFEITVNEALPVYVR